MTDVRGCAALAAGVVALVLVGCGGGSGSEASTAAETTTPPTTTAPATASVGPDDIRAVVEQVFEDDAAAVNAPSASVRSISVKRAKPSGYRVVVRLDSGDTREYAEYAMRDVYRAIYTAAAAAKVRKAEVEIWTDVTDAYGNESEAPVLTTEMSRSVAERVNWDNLDAIDFGGVWTETFSSNGY